MANEIGDDGVRKILQHGDSLFTQITKRFLLRGTLGNGTDMPAPWYLKHFSVAFQLDSFRTKRSRKIC